MFEITTFDSVLLKQIMTEANIVLASVINKYGENSKEHTKEYASLETLIHIFHTIEDVNKTFDINTKIIFDNINKIRTTGLLTPLTLSNDEFPPKDKVLNRYNNRCMSVVKDDNGIYYENAFVTKPIRYYEEESNKEVKVSECSSTGEGIIYLTAGGVTTGEYFDKCYLLPTTIERGMYTPKDAIQVPVSIIKNTNGKLIATMDKREPKYNALKSFYQININTDDTIKSKYDIRKYEKIERKNTKKAV